MVQRQSIDKREGHQAESHHPIAGRTEELQHEQYDGYPHIDFPDLESPFFPSIDTHRCELLMRQSDESRSRFLIQVQQNYGNQYVQSLIEHIDSGSGFQSRHGQKTNPFGYIAYKKDMDNYRVVQNKNGEFNVLDKYRNTRVVTISSEENIAVARQEKKGKPSSTKTKPVTELTDYSIWIMSDEGKQFTYARKELEKYGYKFKLTDFRREVNPYLTAKLGAR